MIKPLYVCALCHASFVNNPDTHDVPQLTETSGAPVLYSGNYKIIKCKGELKPVFYAEDIKLMIENQMSHERQYEAVAQTQLTTIECASSLNSLRELLETIESKLK